YRRAMEIAVVGAAALVVLDAAGRIETARVALTAVAPTCLRAPAAEAALSGVEPTPEALRQAAGLAAAAAAPIADVPARQRERRRAGRSPARARRGGRHPVRLLHAGHADLGHGSARRAARADRGRGAAGAGREPLPLHGLPEDRAGRAHGGGRAPQCLTARPS